MKKFTFDLDGRPTVGTAAIGNGLVWVHLDGETFAVSTEKRSRRGKAAGAAQNPAQILAPMPGKIIKVMTRAGNAVEAGQVLMVMEAMKMEYTLKAQAVSTVQEVQVEAGQQVTLGQLLVRLEV